jgi:hypothetical protein
MTGSMLLASCTEGEQPERKVPTTAAPTTSETVATSSPTVDEAVRSSIAPTMSAQEQDEVDITTTLEDYTAALDSAKNGESSIEVIYPYASGTAREQWVTQVMAYDAQGLTLTGETSLEVVDIEIDDDAAEVVACIDVSNTDAVDQNGQSVVPEDLPDRTLVHFVLERGDWAEHGWAVTEDNNRDEPCTG